MKPFRLPAALASAALLTLFTMSSAMASVVVDFAIWVPPGPSYPPGVVDKTQQIDLVLESTADTLGTVFTLKNRIGVTSTLVQIGFGASIEGIGSASFTASEVLPPSNAIPPVQAVRFEKHVGTGDLVGTPFGGSAALYLQSTSYLTFSQQTMGLDRNDENLVIVFPTLPLSRFTDALARPGNDIAVGLQEIGPEFQSATYVNAIPEPGTWLLMAAGLAVMTGVARRTT
jgi:hypothetical protein